MKQIDRLCIQCGKSFKTTKRLDHKTCSIECRGIYIKSSEHIRKKYDGMQNGMLKKYGVDHPSKLLDHTDKIRKTKLERYGDEKYVNADAAKNTKLKRYGNSSYNNIEKNKQTMLERYGVNNFSKTLKFKESHFDKVIKRLPETIVPQFEFADYTGVTATKYNFLCTSCNNKFNDYIDNGHMPICKVCNPNKITSQIETEIIEFIKEFYTGTIIQSDRNILRPREIDIFIPDKKLGIEINGLYFHTEISGGKDKNYHNDKTTKCSEVGITLMHILDFEWNEKKDIIKGIIKSKFGIHDNKIYARNTEVKKIDYEDYSNFLIENHLQGAHKSSIRYGCYHAGKLISVMSFGNSRYDKHGYEMMRYCTLNNTSIIGGFAKLLNAFIKDHDPARIISYADRRFFDGGIYAKNNFTLKYITKPSYHYVYGTAPLLSRQKFQKHKLSKVLENFDSSVSEWKNMQNNGYDRIWDCGHLKWAWYRK